MAKIIILRAGGKKEYEMTNAQVQRISDAVDLAKKSGVARMVKFDNIEFMTTDYRGAEYDKEQGKGENPISKQIREWHEKRRQFALRSVEEKTDHFMRNGFALFKSVVEMAEGDEQMIRTRVSEFFKANPKRCYPDGSIFENSWNNKTIDTWDSAKLRILDNVIRTDALSVKDDERYEKKLKGMTSMGQGGFEGITDEQLKGVF